MEHMEQQMQQHIEAGLSQADRCYTRIRELEESQIAMLLFVEGLMANIGAGATMNEICDQLCDWWDDKSIANSQLREHDKAIAKSGFIAGYESAWSEAFGLEKPQFLSEYKANEYVLKIIPETKP